MNHMIFFAERRAGSPGRGSLLSALDLGHVVPSNDDHLTLSEWALHRSRTVNQYPK